jgi:Holliday junction resolvasome RuvABC endonuclease subunit
MLVLGIDPGASGAIALIDTALSELVVRDMPTVAVTNPSGIKKSSKRLHISDAGLADLIAAWAPEEAWLERVHAMPRQGVTSSFTFGMAYGLVRGVLAALRVRYFVVTPNEWKRSFRLGADKGEARLMAARMFPTDAQLFSRVRDDGRAEAALLALFGSRQRS